MGLVESAWTSETDWLATPAAVSSSILVRQAQRRVQRQGLERLRSPITTLASELVCASELTCLRKRIDHGSRHASTPPSSDGAGVKPPEQRKGRGPKRGGQPGHPGPWLQRLPIERANEVAEHHPDAWRRCGTLLEGEHSAPLRPQVMEMT